MMAVYALMGLAVSSLASATVLPGNSELALVALLRVYPKCWFWAWMVASCANTLGSLITYAMGRCVPKRQQLSARTLGWLQRYGAWALLLSWVPLLGDALPLGAGWLRLKWIPCVLALWVGKAGRYAGIIGAWWVLTG